MLLVLLAALALPACGAGSGAVAPSRAGAAGGGEEAQVKAVTTLSVLADMIRNVGGDRVSVENIIPIGAGPEDYQPTPQDARKIAAADVVFFNGHGLEAWLDDLFESAARPGQPQIAVSAGLPAIGASDEFPEGNPHFWLSAALGARYVDAIRAGLARVDPAGATTYAENAEAYRARLLALDNELKQQAARIPAAARKIVANHNAFPYFAQAYGFTIVGDLLGNPESEPSAGDLARLMRAIRQENVKVVVAEAQFNPKLAQILADEAGVKLVADLYTDTLGEPGSLAPTYVEMLRYDMRQIVAALQ
jgi:ABC-type Zn uptake system ZnuABC Zn-binding protein ZnuA